MQTIEQLKLVVKIIEENLEWEYRSIKTLNESVFWGSEVIPGPWIQGKVNTVGVLTEIVSNPGKELRIKEKEFPPLPPGYSWWNPENLKPKDIPNGFRLLTKEELKSGVAFSEQFLFKREFLPDWNMVCNPRYVHLPELRYTYIVTIETPLTITYKFE